MLGTILKEEDITIKSIQVGETEAVNKLSTGDYLSLLVQHLIKLVNGGKRKKKRGKKEK